MESSRLVAGSSAAACRPELQGYEVQIFRARRGLDILELSVQVLILSEQINPLSCLCMLHQILISYHIIENDGTDDMSALYLAATDELLLVLQ